MGRQIQFHMLAGDCAAFLDFVQRQDPVVVVFRDGDSPDVTPIADPCKAAKTACLWNKTVLPQLSRKYIADADNGPYYRVDDDLPVLEFSPSAPVVWEGLPAILQGRVWGAFSRENPKLSSWYGTIRRWICKTYIRYEPLSGYISPAVWEWRKSGGILLPMFKPPATDAWRTFVEKQLSGADFR